MDKLLHTLFEEQVRKDPNKIAVSFGDESHTYDELNELSNRLARYLKDQGVSNETFVGIYMNRSFEMIVAMMAVLKAGATYVPLDPKQPDKRINLIVEHSKMEYLISDAETKGNITSVAKEICIADIKDEIQGLDVFDLNVQASSDQVAYTIFTSGSTGVPKGVMIKHSNVVAFIGSMSRVLELTKKDRVLAITTITFDISVLEIFMTLSAGAEVILADYNTSINAFMLNRLCEEKQPTIMQATPATWYMLLDSTWKGSEDLQILCGGEYWGVALAEQLVGKCKKLWNVYGPTETTVWVSTSQYLKGDSNVNLGNPLDGTKMYILNEDLDPVPNGESGELYIAGAQVGKGYFNNPDKTKEAFIITDKFEDGLLYKTGDRVRLNADGKIEYIERVDFQVKIRGFRIELGDIENYALMIPEVKQAAAVVKVHNDDKVIALYVVGDQSKIDKKKILEELRENLPYYMIPQIIEFMDALPMNDNRKVDRKKLESLPIDQNALTREYIPPTTPLEEEMVDIWKEVLEIDQVGITDNFLEIGGHSLLLNRVVKKLRDRLDMEITVLDLLTNDLTVVGMVQAVESKLFNDIDEDLLNALEGMTEEEIAAFLEEHEI